MALARIFTRYPEHTAVLTRQLQEQGYEVEVLSPSEEAPSTSAELEIEMEPCDPADVLRRAAELAAGLGADIAVAPGVLTVGSEAIVTRMPETEQPAPIPAVANPVLVEEDLAARGSETVDLAAEDIDHPQEAPAGVAAFQVSAARSLGVQIANVVAGARNLLAAILAGFREGWERSRVRASEAHERRQEVLLEMAHRRLEAAQRAVDLESVRRAADVALLPEGPDSRPGSALSKPPALNKEGRALRIPQRAASVALAAGLAACFTVGVVVASLRSHPAASSGQGVTVQGATAKSSVSRPETQPKPTLPSRPSPVLRKTAVKPEGQAHRTPNKASKPSQDLVADDVVVRHLPPPKPAPPTQAKGWKHFSDTSN